MRGGAALHGRKGGGAMPRGKRAYRVLLWAVLAALLALAAFAGWRLCLTRPTHYIIVPL